MQLGCGFGGCPQWDGDPHPSLIFGALSPLSTTVLIITNEAIIVDYSHSNSDYFIVVVVGFFQFTVHVGGR